MLIDKVLKRNKDAILTRRIHNHTQIGSIYESRLEISKPSPGDMWNNEQRRMRWGSRIPDYFEVYNGSEGVRDMTKYNDKGIVK